MAWCDMILSVESSAINFRREKSMQDDMKKISAAAHAGDPIAKLIILQILSAELSSDQRAEHIKKIPASINFNNSTH